MGRWSLNNLSLAQEGRTFDWSTYLLLCIFVALTSGVMWEKYPQKCAAVFSQSRWHQASSHSFTPIATIVANVGHIVSTLKLFGCHGTGQYSMCLCCRPGATCLLAAAHMDAFATTMNENAAEKTKAQAQWLSCIREEKRLPHQTTQVHTTVTHGATIIFHSICLDITSCGSHSVKQTCPIKNLAVVCLYFSRCKHGVRSLTFVWCLLSPFLFVCLS